MRIGTDWRTAVSDAEWHAAMERARLRYRRLGRHLRRTGPKSKSKTRASDVAPKRPGDGLKPNHAARAVSIGDCFPLVGRQS